MSNSYFFLIGRTPDLSLQELQALVPDQTVQEVSPELLQVELADDAVAVSLFNQLGGALKVMKDVGRFHDITEEAILDTLAAYLAQFPKPTFAIAEFNRNNYPKIELQFIKNRLKERNVSSRFVEGSRSGLSAAVLTHHSVIEMNLIQILDDVLFTQTLASQDIDDWTRRDRSKPYSDRKKGMLPPKLARMMLNLGRGDWQTVHQADEPAKPLSVVYDPFCGSGTVLLEALMLDLPVIGSDLDKDSVAGTQNNLDWFSETYQKQIAGRVFYCDATNVTPDQFERKVDLIVTEPFLGKPTPQLAQLPNIYKGLEKLYWGTFRQWTKILAEGAVIVIVFPYVDMEKHVFSLEKLIDKLADLGYTPVSEPILYHRPLAVVQRQVWQFVFKKPVKTK